jgi:UrcA family protein
MLSRVRIAALSATLLMPGLVPAHADEVSRETIVAPESPQLERRSELVAIGDLNLRSEVGQAALMRRLSHAAKDVCGPVVDSRVLQDVQGFHACYDTAMADATVKVRTFLAAVPQANESIASIIVAGPAGQ